MQSESHCGDIKEWKCTFTVRGSKQGNNKYLGFKTKRQQSSHLYSNYIYKKHVTVHVYPHKFGKALISVPAKKYEMVPKYAT